MIVCAPDMSVSIASKFGVEPCILTTPGRTSSARGVKVLADIGLTGARMGIDATMYLLFIRRVRPTWAITPDKFGDFRTTLAQWFRYSPIISKYSAPIFVGQEFHRPRIIDAVLDLARMHVVERVALPMRRHPDVSCGSQPRLCAERAERTLRALCGVAKHVHLLGPSLRSVRLLLAALRQCEQQGTVVSFDTAAYRRAPNSQVKKQLGGRWMPRNSDEAAAMLEAWLRQALL